MMAAVKNRDRGSLPRGCGMEMGKAKAIDRGGVRCADSHHEISPISPGMSLPSPSHAVLAWSRGFIPCLVGIRHDIDSSRNNVEGDATVCGSPSVGPGTGTRGRRNLVLSAGIPRDTSHLAHR